MIQRDTQFIADLLPQIVWTARPDGAIDYVNRRWAVYAGRAFDGLGWSWQELVAVDDLPRVQALWRQAIETGETFQAECRLRRSDGVYRWHLLRGDPLHDGQGVILKWFGTSTDIEDQKAADEARLRLAAIVESCDDAILGMTLGGIITSWNAAAGRVYGYSAEEAIGRHISLIIPPERKDDSRQLLEKVSSGACVAHFETVRVRKDGRLIEVLLTVSPIKDQQGRIIGISKLSRDITQQKRAQEELRLAKEAAEAANKAKDQFLAMLSHELRTPLTPVLAVVTALRAQDNWPRDLREELEIIHRSVELEARLIDDLLDLTGIMRGTLRLNREQVDIHAILEAAADVCAQEMAAKSLELRIELKAEQHRTEGDAGRLQQVFWNVLRNAVKFTPEGGKITIRTWNEAKAVEGNGSNGVGAGKGEASLHIEVADTGIGIHADFLPRLFTAFEQGRDSNNGRFGGLGMGLTITKALVEMHGGQIEAVSEGPGLGAAFEICLPAVRPTAVPSLSEAAEVESSRRGIRILLVEDHESSRRVLARLLRSMNHEVTVAKDMSSALREVSANQFDLLISDLGLPDGSGFELMSRLRGTSPLRGICLSGFGTEEDVRRSREAGFLSHLVKPISFQMLQAAIGQVMGEPVSAAVQ